MTGQYKAIMLGDTGVGKTSIINAFRNINEQPQPTVSYQSYPFNCEWNGVEFTIGIWDLPGQDKFRQITKTFLRDVDIALIVYDITSTQSFDRADQDYKLLLEETPNPNVFIIGNKWDLESNRAVLEAEGQGYANQIGAKFFEVSATNNRNIVELFNEMQQVASETRPPTVRTINLQNTKNNQKKCC